MTDIHSMSEADIRKLATELLHENRRLRTILDALARAEVGVGALVEVAIDKSFGAKHIGVVVCRADRDEGAFMRDIRDALEALGRDFFRGAGVEDEIGFGSERRMGSTRVTEE